MYKLSLVLDNTKNVGLREILRRHYPVEGKEMTAMEYFGERVPYLPDGEILSTVVRQLERSEGRFIVIFAIKYALQNYPQRVELTEEEDRTVSERVKESVRLVTQEAERVFDELAYLSQGGVPHTTRCVSNCRRTMSVVAITLPQPVRKGG